MDLSKLFGGGRKPMDSKPFHLSPFHLPPNTPTPVKESMGLMNYVLLNAYLRAMGQPLRVNVKDVTDGVNHGGVKIRVLDEGKDPGAVVIEIWHEKFDDVSD